MNEANNCTFEAFTQLEIRTKKGIYIDYNPTNEFWAHTDLIGRENVDFIILTYKDNEALDPQIVKALESRQNRTEWWKVYGLGQLGEVEGRIYKGWQIIDEIPHEARLERYGLDFGYTNDPTAIVAVYYYNGGYILDEVCYQTGLLNKQIADILKGVPLSVVIADSAEPKSIDEIRQYGITVLPTPKGKDSVRQGIQQVQWQKISVTKNSVNLIKEYRNYLWGIDKDGRFISPNMPEKGQADHALDAVRYAITSIKVPNTADVIAQMRNRIATQRRNILTNQVE
jgi:phage terminase large subunit